MKRFAWRLQKVLDVKTKQEQIKRNELFQITEQLAAQRGELLMRQRILQDLMAEIQGHESPARLNAQEFFLRHAAADDEQIRRLQEEIAALHVRQKEKTAELLAVKRFKEGLEKLREQAKEQYLREQEKTEQKESDERTTLAFVRNQGDLEDRRPRTEDRGPKTEFRSPPSSVLRLASSGIHPRSSVLQSQEHNE
jgi:flagellar biosynthesis chaperone FliJ